MRASHKKQTAAVAVLGLLAVGCMSSPSPTRPARLWPVAVASPLAPALPTTPEPLPRPLPDDPMAVTVHRLRNGLTVYISTDRSQPRIAARITVRVGSRHDPPGSTGLAHYLEHMLFKGSDRLGTLDGPAERPHLQRIVSLYSRLHAEVDPAARQRLYADIDRETQASARWAIPNELERVYAGLGVTNVNAATGVDSTTFIRDLPSNRLRHWARVEFEALGRPNFRLFLPELAVVYEELNRALDSPDRRGFEAMLALLYPRHPYGTQTVLGRPEHLNNPDFAGMVEQYRRWYVPNNMAVILAGDVDPATALPVLEAELGAWPARPLPDAPAGELPALSGRQLREVPGDNGQQVNIAWRVVPDGHPDAPALEVMNLLMDDATSGLIKRTLVRPQRLARAGSFLTTYRESASWTVWAVARDGQPLAEVEQLLLDCVDRLKRGDFAEADLRAVVLGQQIAEQQGLESNEGRAREMAAAFVRGVSWAEVVARPARRQRVTRADVVRVATQYFGPDRAVVYRRPGKVDVPALAPPRITELPLESDRKSAFAREVEAIPAPVLQPSWLEPTRDYQRIRLPSGKLLAARNRRNNLFHLTYRFDMGSRRLPLLCHALAVQKTAGAGELDGDVFRRRLFALGATVETSCQVDETQIVVSGPDDNMEATLALVRQWFVAASFDEPTLRAVLVTTLGARKTTLGDPEQAAEALTQLALRGAGSRFLLVPNNGQLTAARVPELKRLLASLLEYQHRTLYFGPRSAAEAARVVALGSGRRVVPVRPRERYRHLARPAVFLLDRPLAQAQITVAFPGASLAKRDQAAALVLSRYLGGGLESAVSQELRERSGLAYSAETSFEWGQRPGDEAVLSSAVETQPANAGAAITRVLQLLRAAALEPARLEETRRGLEQRLRATRTPPRRIVSLVDAWDDYQEPRDPRGRLLAEVTALTAADVARFWQRAVKRPFVVAITGQRDGLDLAQLRRLAPVQDVQTDQLFGFGPFASPAQKIAATAATD